MAGHAAPDKRHVTHATRPPISNYMPSIAVPPEIPPQPIAIADMASLFDVTHRTLHFYEQKGLLVSSRAGKRRVYAAADVTRMALISLCRDVGMPVAAIQDLFDDLRSATSRSDADRIFQAALRNHMDMLSVTLTTIRRQASQIETLLGDEETIAPFGGPVPDLSHIMSETELHCLQLMAEGYSTIRITHAMKLEKHEVETLERGLIAKFKANNRFQAVAKAALLGLVTSRQATIEISDPTAPPTEADTSAARPN